MGPERRAIISSLKFFNRYAVSGKRSFPMPVAAANDAVTHDAIDEPAFEGRVAPPIRLADWIEVEIDEHAAAEADLPLEVLEAPVAEVPVDEIEAPAFEATVFETPVFDAPVEAVANDVEPMPIEAEPVVEDPVVELPPEDTVAVPPQPAPAIVALPLVLTMPTGNVSVNAAPLIALALPPGLVNTMVMTTALPADTALLA